MLAAVLAVNNGVRMMFPLKYKTQVVKYSLESGLDPFLVFAVIKAESSFNPNAVSPKNARGLMQITDRTGIWGARILKLKDFNVDMLYDPDINIRIGCWYLKTLMKEFNNNEELVIIAYNGGSGNVSEWLKDRKYSDSGGSVERIPFKETEAFLKRVKNFYKIYKVLYENPI